MALTFALVASLAAVGGPLLVRANQYGRYLALAVFCVLGLSLLWPAFAEQTTRPFVRLGNRIQSSAGSRSGTFSSVLLGVAMGLLWAPCAGPILGLILAGAAIGGATMQTSFLLLAYAAGAATSLAIALLAGGKVFTALKGSLRAERWIRPTLGVVVLAAVASVALGLDRGLLAQISLARTSGLEQRLVDRFHLKAAARGNSARESEVQDEPSFGGATAWLNSPPLRLDQLHGKVVLIDFWTYSCINCLRTIPYVRAWSEKYRADGLVVIGVHTPEFAFEKDSKNVGKAVRDLHIQYPVAIDNDYEIWSSFNNEYWPAHYFLDATGKLRFKHFGEGGVEESEKWIRQLLREHESQISLPAETVSIQAEGAEAAADSANVRSPETYVGYERAKGFASPGGQRRDVETSYPFPRALALNDWALGGTWTVQSELATSGSPGARVRYRFHARDLHLVLGLAPGRTRLPFRITIDGHAPGESHGVDTDERGNGVLTEHRLYQLLRQKGKIQDHTFEIEFSAPGAQAFAFTFG